MFPTCIHRQKLVGEIQKNLASSLQNMVLIGKQAVNSNIKFLFDEFTCQKVGVQVGVAPLVQEVGLVYPGAGVLR